MNITTRSIWCCFFVVRHLSAFFFFFFLLLLLLLLLLLFYFWLFNSKQNKKIRVTSSHTATHRCLFYWLHPNCVCVWACVCNPYVDNTNQIDGIIFVDFILFFFRSRFSIKHTLFLKFFLRLRVSYFFFLLFSSWVCACLCLCVRVDKRVSLCWCVFMCLGVCVCVYGMFTFALSSTLTAFALIPQYITFRIKHTLRNSVYSNFGFLFYIFFFLLWCRLSFVLCILFG